jgi:hypothetical protein
MIVAAALRTATAAISGHNSLQDTRATTLLLELHEHACAAFEFPNEINDAHL